MRNRVEVALQIGIDDVRVTRFEQLVHSTQRVFASPAGAKAVAVLREITLEDRFQDVQQCRLNHPVAHCGNSQRPLFLTPRFGDVVSADLLRSIMAALQILAELLQVLFQAFIEHLDRHVIHPGGTFVGGDLRERGPQYAFGMNLVDQTEPLASFDPLFEGCQHPHCPNQWFDPAPTAQDLSGTSSLFRHCLRLFFRRFGHCVSTFLRPLAPPELPGLLATMGALTPGRPALRLPREHEHRLWRRPGLHASCHRTFRSFRLQPPAVVPTRLWVFLRWAYRTTLPWSPFSRVQASFGLRHYLAYVWGGRDPRAVAPRSDSANFPGFFSILCSVFRDSVVTIFRVIS